METFFNMLDWALTTASGQWTIIAVVTLFISAIVLTWTADQLEKRKASKRFLSQDALINTYELRADAMRMYIQNPRSGITDGLTVDDREEDMVKVLSWMYMNWNRDTKWINGEGLTTANWLLQQKYSKGPRLWIV